LIFSHEISGTPNDLNKKKFIAVSHNNVRYFRYLANKNYI